MPWTPVPEELGVYADPRPPCDASNDDADYNNRADSSRDDGADYSSLPLNLNHVPMCSYPHIQRLNSDSLHLIFELVADIDRPDPHNPEVGECWMKLGQVCRLWRTALLNMPSLWARDLCAFGPNKSFEQILVRTRDAPLHLDFPRSSPESILNKFFEEILARTRDAPLHPDFPRSSPENTLVRMASYIPRAGALHCTIQTPEDYQSIESILSSCHLPALDTLDVNFDCRITDIDFRQDIVLAGDSHITKFRACDILIWPPQSGRLTSLEICLSGMKSERRILCDAILDILSHNPNLKSVSLMCALRKSGTISRFVPITMPVLSNISVYQNDVSSSSFELLAHLRVPVIERLSVSNHSINTAISTSQGMACTLQACTESPLLTSSNQLSCSLKPSKSTICIAISDRGSAFSEEADEDVSFRFLLDSASVLQHYPDILDLMSAALHPLSEAGVSSRVATLTCFPWGVAEAESAQFWKATLNTFSNASSLHACATEHELLALFDALSRHEEGERVLPRLDQLTVRLSRRPGILRPGKLFWFPEFEHALRKRVEMDSPIREVRIRFSTKHGWGSSAPSYPATVEQMRKVAMRVGAEMNEQEWRHRRGTGDTLMYQDAIFCLRYA
ncbi:hypothetical protein PENSPDRAFT_659165 [Peniophora sp. CONT]|nr:hypothetical protein PENSPDRAFT_659165 [Peniophora sp. CONT]